MLKPLFAALSIVIRAVISYQVSQVKEITLVFPAYEPLSYVIMRITCYDSFNSWSFDYQEMAVECTPLET